MIAKLAEPKISANIPRPFPRVRGGVWERDYIIDAVNFFYLNLLSSAVFERVSASDLAWSLS